MLIDQITGLIVDACIKIHRRVGPGCYEKVYEEILYYELAQRSGLRVDRQMAFPIKYDHLVIEDAYRLDMLVEDSVVLELKSVYPVPPVCFNQVRAYLSMLNLKYGMLLNFKVPLMKEGIHRVFNNFGVEALAKDSL